MCSGSFLGCGPAGKCQKKRYRLNSAKNSLYICDDVSPCTQGVRIVMSHVEAANKHIVILGGGTGGTLMANRLAKHASRNGLQITVVDKDNDHIYQPALLFVPFGDANPHDLIKGRKEQLKPSVQYLQKDIDHVRVDANTVVLEDASELKYDVLVVATGAILMPEETDGLLGEGWGRTVFTFYDLEGAVGLHRALSEFEGGNLVINVVDMPIKCPVAPLEFAFLADAYFTKLKKRDSVEITYVTPLDAAFTKPVAARHLADMLVERRINLVTNFNTGEVDETERKLVSYDGRTIGYDLLVTIPLHGGAAYVGRSPKLGDELNFIPTDSKLLQSKVAPNIFVIGDASGIPISKAGSVAHFEGEVLVANILSYLNNEELSESFDGHVNCFIETGHQKALLIDFNYETEPLEGHFPGPFGLPLLKESRLNHLGKLAFQYMYLEVLLRGLDIPTVRSKMSLAGKHLLSISRMNDHGVVVAEKE